VIWNNVK